MKLLLVRLASLPVAAALIMLAGCEAESSDEAEITITPALVNLNNGQSVEFTATGGRDYTWSLVGSNADTYGTLSRVSGDTTVYTSRTTNSVTTHIKAESRQIAVPSGTTSSGTNATSITTGYLSGQAVIVHGSGGEVSVATTTTTTVVTTTTTTTSS